jgi:BlaI family penicillinase repressor
MRQFTAGELDVMQILWKHGELKPGDIQEHFPKPIKNPALRSHLSFLIEKGHVSRRKVGKAFVYKAVTRRESVFRRMLSDVVDVFCEGSQTALLLNLIQNEKLSDAELLKLKRRAEKENG